jgi:hypothetical protein
VHDEVVGESAKVHWAPGILSKCQTRDPLLCEWSGRRIDWFASLTGREVVFEQAMDCAKSKLAVKTWELDRAARILQVSVVMNVVVLRRPTTCFEDEVEDYTEC